VKNRANRIKNLTKVLDALTKNPAFDRSEEARKFSYKLALPELDTVAHIREFIGHVAQGIAHGIFTGREGSQLLYAAQVALTLVKKS
jgi:hypothetical protein